MTTIGRADALGKGADDSVTGLGDGWRGRAGVTGGESAAVTGEARGGVISGTGGGVAGGVEHRHYRRGRLQA